MGQDGERLCTKAWVGGCILKTFRRVDGLPSGAQAEGRHDNRCVGYGRVVSKRACQGSARRHRVNWLD
jgi:hypothetical protein